ncbi:Prolamin-like domain [Dillenia turbinata]|uniref:Prolamin-like domain n=1 Tax=Dillenia turbinata TaxID=194707 RepID=A0AAN8UK43_9MAGN
MAHSIKLFLTLLLTWNMVSMVVMARPLMMTKSTLAARLKADEEGSKCWDSLFELQACTGEAILFFLNGETYLGPGCCRAIEIIEHQCWPAMLTSLGFTPQEGDILRGYCDAAEEDDDHN